MTFEDQLSSHRRPAKIPVADTSVEEKLFVSEPTSHKNDFYSNFGWPKRKTFCREYEVPNFKPANQFVVVSNKRCKGWLAGRIMPAAVYEARSSGPPGIAGDQQKNTDRILSCCCSLVEGIPIKELIIPIWRVQKKNTHTSNIKHQPTSLFLLGSSTSKTRMGQLTIKKKDLLKAHNSLCKHVEFVHQTEWEI